MPIAQLRSLAYNDTTAGKLKPAEPLLRSDPTMRKTKSSRTQSIPQHRLDVSRQQWTRKPQTQVVANKKAEQRRTMCRKKGIPDGAIFISKRPVISTEKVGRWQQLRSGA
jgi:hypothetical protein